jgi:heme exporter protein C
MRTGFVVPLLMLLALAMFVPSPFIMGSAPYETSMGIISKIFYFHVPVAITFMLSAFVCGIAGVIYLVRRSPTADHVALAAAELAIVFGIIVLVTGSIWARKAWGVWWVWDARLTMTLVMWMVFVSYLLLRRFGGPGSEMLSATVSIFGMALVPFVYWSVNVWRTMHPATTVLPTLPRSMGGPILWNFAAFLLFYTGLLLVRVRLAHSADALEEAFLGLED